ncbi:hypothetical protein BT63DRAFT_441410 [Microthyrium microscopicum]|uniref:BTB domain-containing protein n=1 Tax=Microthyrium microscopicum TaxID=703497 RepID=A0A6A6U974_9PEZI|nr:hypothetical protein BT63DRAFT_441410 [Microthyrium microscopicum]
MTMAQSRINTTEDQIQIATTIRDKKRKRQEAEALARKRRNICSARWATGGRCEVSSSYSFRGPSIQIIVGEGHDTYTPHTFTVLQDVLTADSLFFRNMLQSKFKEGSEGVVRLPDQDPDVFEVYLKYLYQQKIFTANDLSPQNHEGTYDRPTARDKLQRDARAAAEAVILVQAISLADYLQSDHFHNASIDALIESCQVYGWTQFTTTEAVALVVEVGVPSLLKLTRDILIFEADYIDPEEEVSPEVSKFYYNALAEAVKWLKRGGQPSKRPWDGDRCQYHRHPENKNGDDSVQVEEAENIDPSPWTSSHPPDW